MGGFWEEASDVISFSLSLHEFIKNPNWKTGGWLALDTAAVIIPLVPAIGGYIQKSAKAAKAADKVLGAAVVAKTANKIVDTGKVVNKTSNLTVIGHLPEYVDVAKKLGANYLKPSKDWNWKKQGEFIKGIIERGDYVLIGTRIRQGKSVLKKEIKQLYKAGYRPVKKGSKLLKKVK